MSTEPERRRRRADVVGILEPNPHPLATVTIGIGAVVVLTVIGFFLGSVDAGLAKAFNTLHTGASVRSRRRSTTSSARCRRSRSRSSSLVSSGGGHGTSDRPSASA